MLDSGVQAVAISWKQYRSVKTEYMPNMKEKKRVGSFFLPALMGGWDDVSRGMEGRQLSAGSGLMDNVPLDQRLLPTRHDWYSSGVHSSFRSHELIQLLQLRVAERKR